MAHKALCATNSSDISIVEKEIPAPPPKGLVVKVGYAGVCHSDAHLWQRSAVKFPIVLGHEMCGTVHSLGSEQDQDEPRLTIGQHVMVFPWGGCRKCEVCVSGHNACDKRYNTNAHVYGCWQDGGFQEYISVLDKWSVLPIPDAIPMEVACLLPCSGLTAYNALSKAQGSLTDALRFRGVAHLMIIGAGGVGLWAIELARALYKDKISIIVVDLDKMKLNDAKNVGADITLNWGKDGSAKSNAELVIEAAGGQQMDAALDFVNAPSTVERAFHCMAMNGSAVLVGLFGGEMPPLPLATLALRQIKLFGLFTGTKLQLTELLQLFQDEQLSGPPLQFIRLEEVAALLRSMRDEAASHRGRTVVKFF